MKKRLFIFLVIMIFVVGGLTFYIYINNATVKTVNTLIENVDKGNIKGIGLSNEQLNSIKKMITFSNENNLSEPKININKISNDGNKEELLVQFEIFQYRNDNQIENIYVGSLLFTLVKKSILKWEVLDVKTMNVMEMQL
ncbi:hypothetical protein J45TS6_30670 [Paenibacillus sp. J45TS6]|uniref:hypothetical protein n=1 Tax=unclassified Paenibacillus TaxID=185978 RepID=UPI001B158FBA|nr:hypothetical protein [Paenibacillus sp. J45TS6]GIP44608.1 hypothetical protein J45TS6_30670 [Paenibacillus sp. J45TS6]